MIGPFDAASTSFQRQAREAVLGSAVFIVPAVVLNVVVSNLVYSSFSSFDDVVVSVPELIGGVEAATGVETLLAFVSIVVNALAVALAGGFMAVLVTRPGVPGIGGALRSMAGRLPALVAAWMIGHSWLLLGSFVLVRMSAADLAGFAVLLVPAVAWLVSITLLVSPVIVVERLGPLTGLRRARQLVRRRSGAAFAFVALCLLIGGGLRLLIGALPQLVEATGLITFGRFAGVVEGIASQLSQLVVVPLVGLATAHFYLQTRMDREGMDLVIEADRAFPA